MLKDLAINCQYLNKLNFTLNNIVLCIYHSNYFLVIKYKNSNITLNVKRYMIEKKTAIDMLEGRSLCYLIETPSTPKARTCQHGRKRQEVRLGYHIFIKTQLY